MNPSTKIVRINVNVRLTTSIDDLPTDILSSEILVRLPAKCIVDAAGMGNYLFGFHVDSDELKSKPKPATTNHDGDGSLVVVRNQLHMFVANSLPNWSLHLWRMDGENWTKIWVRQNILPPSLFGRTITYVVSTGKFLVVSRSGTVFEIDTTKNGIECYYPVFSESSIQGAVYTETLMSPDF
ncbi:hypothetical protein QVD17_15197 [Tagetes erecta]|uniref:Uncharacterized protein n=1 Tax=Tagetes erecta TaxID=13708 RepID=A0AAD8KPD1_TARER|nr:hypothetical protein QVD17_15197 [Tagetes erecta]